jgi:hypothetical protein
LNPAFDPDPSTSHEDLPLAPYELTVFSFLDAAGVEQPFTITDPEQARVHAARNGLLALRNTYEFVNSEPVADFTGTPAVIAGN